MQNQNKGDQDNISETHENIQESQVNFDDPDYQIGDFDLAVENTEKNSIMDLDENQQRIKYPMSVDSKELGKFGVGLQLYLNLLSSFGNVFFFMFLISIISIISNLTGEGLTAEKDKQQIYILTTLANQPVVRLQTNNQSSNYSEGRVLLCTLPDLAYSIVFLIFIQYFKKSCEEIIKQNQKLTLVIDYALQIKNFDGKTCTNDEELKQHFEQFGKVIEVKYARNYYGTLLKHTQIGLNVKQLEIMEIKEKLNEKKVDKKQFEKLKKKQLSLEKSAEKILKDKNLNSISHDDYESLQAFVIFDEVDVAKQVYKSYRKYRNWYYRVFSCFPCCNARKQMPQNYLFKGQDIRIYNDVDFPSNINWENMDTSYLSKKIRQALSLITVIICMAITFAVILIANTFQVKDSTTCATYTLAQAQTAAGQGTAGEQTVNCYCKSISISIASNTQICDNYVYQFYMAQAINTIASFIIVIVNFLLKQLMINLGKFEKYKTLSEEISKTVIKIFVVLFINTAIIVLLLNGDIFGFKVSYISEVIGIPASSSQKALADDFNRQWYVNVGNNIMTTWIVGTVSPHAVYLLTTPFVNCIKRSSAKKKFLQIEMNEALFGAEFQFQAKSALALNIIFVTMFYCGGMPILLLLGAISLKCQYYCEKYLLIRWYSTPPTYDGSVIKLVNKLIPFSLIFHLCISIYIYGASDIFHQENIFNLDNIGLSLNYDLGSNILNRIYYRCVQQILLFILVLICTVDYILDGLIFNFIQKIFQILLKFICFFRKSTKVNPENDYQENQQEKEFSYTENKNQLEQYGLATYEIRQNRKYKNIIKALDRLASKHQIP